MLGTSFNNAFQPYQQLCTDESLFLYKGRLTFKQPITSKRSRFGTESFLACDGKTSYVKAILLNCGTNTTVNIEYQHTGNQGTL